RPISLIHLVAKAAKLFSLCRAPKLDRLVSNNQNAFIPGRRLHDNFILVKQLARLLHQLKAARALLKLDLAKAFETRSLDRSSSRSCNATVLAHASGSGWPYCYPQRALRCLSMALQGPRSGTAVASGKATRCLRGSLSLSSTSSTGSSIGQPHLGYYSNSTHGGRSWPSRCTQIALCCFVIHADRDHRGQGNP
uniref:Reverse transcriptase domain-containing protein n=1 Tax=Aegilops tauschii subsp. strangulata TaxID=200361 RepID=A0A453MXZ4_AEGTS